MHPTHDDIEQLARHRASAKLRWYLHALAFVAVNLALAGFSGRHWGVFSALGWGLGLAIHGIVVFVAPAGGALHGLLLARERARLIASRDPW